VLHYLIILRWYLSTLHGYQDCDSPSHLRMKTYKMEPLPSVPLAPSPCLQPAIGISASSSRFQLKSNELLWKTRLCVWILTSLSIAHDFEIYKCRQLSFQMTTKSHSPRKQSSIRCLKHGLVQWTRWLPLLCKVGGGLDKWSSGLSWTFPMASKYFPPKTPERAGKFFTVN
jgi:hypothetical protein